MPARGHDRIPQSQHDDVPSRLRGRVYGAVLAFHRANQRQVAPAKDIKAHLQQTHLRNKLMRNNHSPESSAFCSISWKELRNSFLSLRNFAEAHQIGGDRHPLSG